MNMLYITQVCCLEEVAGICQDQYDQLFLCCSISKLVTVVDLLV
jgi:hypothetical protein